MIRSKFLKGQSRVELLRALVCRRVQIAASPPGGGVQPPPGMGGTPPAARLCRFRSNRPGSALRVPRVIWQASPNSPPVLRRLVRSLLYEVIRSASFMLLVDRHAFWPTVRNRNQPHSQSDRWVGGMVVKNVRGSIASSKGSLLLGSDQPRLRIG
jgi:hypothetical protein